MGALAPFPVLLHCDAGTPDDVFAAMTADLPGRVQVLPRMRTGWAKWENVAAEVAGYRAALASTDAGHVAVLTGSDYPLASADEIAGLLAANRDDRSSTSTRCRTRRGVRTAGGRGSGSGTGRGGSTCSGCRFPAVSRTTWCSAAARSSRSWRGTTRRPSSTRWTVARTWCRSGAGCGSPMSRSSPRCCSHRR
ncbi:hypothetical protein P9139_16845 [Curtobacterium flaccumfaciens]|nr:hypothetical protein P9139_16845 [Curtobacterium flaccumfaciens]